MVQQQSAALWQVMAALQSKLGEVQGGGIASICAVGCGIILVLKFFGLWSIPYFWIRNAQSIYLWCYHLWTVNIHLNGWTSLYNTSSDWERHVWIWLQEPKRYIYYGMIFKISSCHIEAFLMHYQVGRILSRIQILFTNKSCKSSL